MDSFDTVEIMFEFSKAIRHGLISLESLNDLDGVDPCKVTALADSVRLAHEEATRYMVTLIASGSPSSGKVISRGIAPTSANRCGPQDEPM